MMKKYCLLLLLCITVVSVYPQKFVHPGIDQTRADLDYMKQQVLSGVQPWKAAFDRLKADKVLNFKVKPFVQVFRGPSGIPNIGGNDLSNGASIAYDCALLWYITGERIYAAKAKEILNAWSDTLWGFDYNDAKLIAGWTGHQLCNAAEIMRYTDSGWGKEDNDRFTKMLTTVYFPMLRDYCSNANGNWDGAVVQTILAIGVFTDNRGLFDSAVNHFLYSKLNGGIFKYIYPSGQCQESTRDQGHVQFGQGQFSGAARIAYTQGLDFFSIGNNRIALGYEYTSGFILGKNTQAYGIISEARKQVADVYEYVYRHYTARGIDLPNTKILADSIRLRSSRSLLTAFRAADQLKSGNLIPLHPSTIGYPAGAMEKPVLNAPHGSIWVKPGESLQAAIDATAGTGKWVIAAKGVHTLQKTLKMPSGVILSGEGLETIIFLDPGSKERDAISNASPDLKDVTLSNMIIEGSLSWKPLANSARSFNNIGRRGGVVFLSDREGRMKNIKLVNLTVRNCVYSGVAMTGAEGVYVSACDFSENGARMVPGQHLLHNLKLSHCSNVLVKDSRFDTSPDGSGIAIEKSHDLQVRNCEIARNGYFGIFVSESEGVSLTNNLIEANDRSGVMMEFLFLGNRDIHVSQNRINYNNGFAIESHSSEKISVLDNDVVGNRLGTELITNDRQLLLE